MKAIARFVGKIQSKKSLKVTKIFTEQLENFDDYVFLLTPSSLDNTPVWCKNFMHKQFQKERNFILVIDTYEDFRDFKLSRDKNFMTIKLIV